jgi:hypothetical protein
MSTSATAPRSDPGPPFFLASGATDENIATGNVFRNCAVHGVQLNYTTTSNIIDGNLVTTSGTNGIALYCGVRHNEVVNNLVVGSGAGATGCSNISLLTEADSNNVQNNLCRVSWEDAQRPAYGISIDAASNYNLVSNNDLLRSGTTAPLHDLSATTRTSPGNRAGVVHLTAAPSRDRRRARITWSLSGPTPPLLGFKLETGAAGAWRTLVPLTSDTVAVDEAPSPGSQYRLFGVARTGEDLFLAETGLSVAGVALAWPNPATTGRVTIALTAGGPMLDGYDHVEIRISDAAGRVVRSWPRIDLLPGSQLFTWDERDTADRAVATGVYWLRARHRGGKTVVQPVHVLR